MYIVTIKGYLQLHTQIESKSFPIEVSDIKFVHLLQVHIIIRIQSCSSSIKFDSCFPLRLLIYTLE